jgi:epsilon-lactone hydrolase
MSKFVEKSWVVLKLLGLGIVTPLGGLFFYLKYRQYSFIAHCVIFTLRMVNTWAFEHVQFIFRSRLKFDPIAQKLHLERDDLDNLWISLHSNEPDLILMHIHGGGFCVGIPEMNLEYHHRILSLLKQRGICAKIYSIDYNLAPIFKFPKQLEDVKKGYMNLLSQGFQHEKIVFLGESAGGNLCLTSLFYLEEDNIPLPKMVLSISPWLILEPGRIYPTNYNDLLHQHFLDKCMYSYTDQFQSYLVNPTLASDETLKKVFQNLPVLITYGGQELLMEDAQKMGDRLKNVRCPVQIDVDDNMPHIYQIGEAIFGNTTIDGISRMIAFIENNK